MADGSRSAPAQPAARKDAWARGETIALLAIVTLVLFGGAYFLWSNHVSMQAEFAKSLSETRADVAGSCYLEFLLAQQMLHGQLELKYVHMLVGATIVFVGALFVLKGVQASYSLEHQTSTGKSALQTSSPGLVLITLGIGMMVVAIQKEHRFDFRPVTCSATVPPPDADPPDETPATLSEMPYEAPIPAP